MFLWFRPREEEAHEKSRKSGNMDFYQNYVLTLREAFFLCLGLGMLRNNMRIHSDQFGDHLTLPHKARHDLNRGVG